MSRSAMTVQLRRLRRERTNPVQVLSNAESESRSVEMRFGDLSVHEVARRGSMHVRRFEVTVRTCRSHSLQGFAWGRSPGNPKVAI